MLLTNPNPSRAWRLMLLFTLGSLAVFGQDWRDFKVKAGDDLAFAAPEFDDSDWLPYRQWRQTAEGRQYKGNFWLRAEVTPDSYPSGTSLALVVVALASCEVYWNGARIGTNGAVGLDRDSEVPGNSIFIAAIPAHNAQPAPQHLAIRFSNYHGGYYFGILGMGISELNRVNQRLRTILWPFVFSSLFFIVAAYFLLVYTFSFRERAFLLFALLNLSVGLLYLVEHWRLLGYPYHYHEARLWTVVALSGVVNLLLVLFFTTMHRLSRWYGWVVLGLMAVAGALLNHHHDGIAFGFFLSGLGLSQALTFRALWLRRPYAIWGTVGCLITISTLVWSGSDFLEGPFFFCFIALILLVLLSLSLQIRHTRQSLHEAKLVSARLETELLRKHIQPHFMMNTLTAAMEWIERDPPAAVRFIKALAVELRALFDVSGRKRIPISEEIAMCRAHLETLSFRTGQKHVFQAEGEADGIEVPPALFLTLLENALTHGVPDCGHRFSLQWDLSGHYFCFETDHQEGPEPDAVEDGTGTRYIKARLEENYPGAWGLTSTLTEQGVWRTEIHLGDL